MSDLRMDEPSRILLIDGDRDMARLLCDIYGVYPRSISNWYTLDITPGAQLQTAIFRESERNSTGEVVERRGWEIEIFGEESECAYRDLRSSIRRRGIFCF